MTRSHGELAASLLVAGSAAARTLRQRRAWMAALQAWRRGGRWLLGVPLLVLLLHLLQRLFAVGLLAVPVGLLVAGTLLPVLAWVVLCWWRVAASRPDVPRGLSRLDHELRLVGRLQAAHEFLGERAPTSFMLAAIDDVDAHVEAAQRHQLQPGSARVPGLLALAGSALLGVLAVLAAPLPGTAFAVPVAELPAAVPAAAARRGEPPAKEPANAAPVPPRPVAAGARQEAAAPGIEERKPSDDAEQPLRESSGKSGQGAAANAQTGSSAGDSRGFQSSEAPPTERGEPSKPGKQKPKAPKPQAESKAPRKQLEPSGATAGKGAGSGSNKNPSSTEWQSKDQVSTDEEQPLTDDQQIDEDTDESEARGGLQPSLRDRRPAVNRDLSIGFGNDPPPPDANGRGGPGEQKKSRGVASLVLGVPIPDHVKGQLNPGKIKITQERVEPRADEAQPIEAQLRAARSQPFGPLRSTALQPWMRQLVRTYFHKLRTESEKPR